MYTVYILYSEKCDRYYVGQTDNIEIRLGRHNSATVRSTKAYVPWKIVHTEEFETRSEAVRREHEVKKKKSRAYIEYICGVC
jgi:putative endonuclease